MYIFFKQGLKMNDILKGREFINYNHGKSQLNQSINKK